MRVAHLPNQPHVYSFGGFEVQMLDLIHSIQSKLGSGEAVYCLNPWTKLDEHDILHCWGLGTAHFHDLRFAKASGKRTVVTALLPYYDSAVSALRRELSKVFFEGAYYARSAQYIDALVLVNDDQREIAVRHFGFKREKTHVVPNSVPAGFKNTAPLQKDDYVITVGNVCRRKNQLLLAKACIAANRRLVIVGGALAGEERLYNEILELAARSGGLVKVVGALQRGGDAMIKLLGGARWFALLSEQEQQPISVLEAASMGCRIIMPNLAWARAFRFANVVYARDTKVDAIAAALSSPEMNAISRVYDLSCYGSEAVADRMLAVYRSL